MSYPLSVLRQAVLHQGRSSNCYLLRAASASAARYPFESFSTTATAHLEHNPTQSAAASSTAGESAGRHGTTATTDSRSNTAADSSHAASSSSSNSGGRTAGPNAAAGAGFAGPNPQQVFENLKSGFGTFSERLRSNGSSGGSSGSAAGSSQTSGNSVGERASRLFQAVAREVREAVLPREETVSLTRAYDGPVYQPSDTPYEGSTTIAAVKQEETWWGKTMQDLYNKYGHHPMFKRLKGVNIKDNPVFKKTTEFADDLRERYETSDHPVVHKVEDVKERLFGMSDAAAALHTIRSRDPSFDMSKLLSRAKCDARVVVEAFLTHDLGTLRKHCGPELMERFEGIFKHFQQQEVHEDPTILYVGDVELVEMKMVEEEPLVVVQFACHQIKCTRDKFGNVIDGSPNSIQKVHYFWGLQQDKEGTVLPNGKLLPPRFVIKDMLWQSMLALV
eukprot:jgi/Chrzof1/9126/Cz03g36270.t1